MLLKSQKYVISGVCGAFFVVTLGGAVVMASLSSKANPQNELVPVQTTPLVLAPAKSIHWETSFETAMQRARVEHKPILIDFYTDWCSACKLFDKNIYPQPAVIAESANWVAVKINSEKRPDVAQAYDVKGLPTILFAEGNGKPIDSFEGYAPDLDFKRMMHDMYDKWQKGEKA